MHSQDPMRPAQDVEPDVISLGGDAVNSSPRSPRSRRRRFIERVLLVLGLGAVLLTVHHIDGSAPTSPRGPAVVADPENPSISARSASPLLVAEAFARPGEWLIVLAYRDVRFCGPAEVRFDGAPTENRRVTENSPTPADRGRFFLRVQIPTKATAGPHELELFGPLPGGPLHPLCADMPEHQGRLGTAPITVLGR